MGLITIPPLGWAKFMSAAHKRPDGEFEKPSTGDDPDKHYADTINVEGEPDWGIPVPGGMPFFTPQHPNKFHQDTCNDQGSIYQKIHDGCLDAIKFGVDMWKLQAKFQDMKINAGIVAGSPGCLKGPSLEDFIKIAPGCASWNDQERKYLDGCAAGTGKCFKDWQDQVSVPGLPLYPTMIVFPGPMHPPVPNIPMPLITFLSGKISTVVAPSDLKGEMCDALDGGLKDKDVDSVHETLYDSIATVASLGFLMFMGMQQIMLCLGYGQIPTFAPPFVPVGPVVNGGNLPIPGHALA